MPNTLLAVLFFVVELDLFGAGTDDMFVVGLRPAWWA